MSGWTQEISRRLKEQNEGQRVSGNRTLQDRSILGDGLNAEWRNLLDIIKKKCGEINDDNEIKIKLNCTMRSPTKIVVSRQDTGAMITAERGPNDEVAFVFVGTGVTFIREVFIRMNPHSHTVFLADKDGIPIEEKTEQLAAEIVEALLGL